MHRRRKQAGEWQWFREKGQVAVASSRELYVNCLSASEQGHAAKPGHTIGHQPCSRLSAKSSKDSPT